MKNVQLRGQQSGFTLIELVVVIVILGILAATALPRFSDMSTDARAAKMQAALAAVKSASAMAHGAWLAKSGVNDNDGTNTAVATSLVTMEGQKVAMFAGYPDVGNDGGTDTATDVSTSGILVAAGGLGDYKFDSDATPAVTSATTINIYPDAAHIGSTTCVVTYTQATQGAATPFATLTAPTITIDVSDCS